MRHINLFSLQLKASNINFCVVSKMKEVLVFPDFIQPFFYNSTIIFLIIDILNCISYFEFIDVFPFSEYIKVYFRIMHKCTQILNNGVIWKLFDNTRILIEHMNTMAIFFQKHDAIPQFKRFNALNYSFAFINKPSLILEWRKTPHKTSPLPSTNSLRKLLAIY